METLLITGATGNIGQKLREKLESTGNTRSAREAGLAWYVTSACRLAGARR
jgi:short-subunit dehydrogenase involved in D-alanine esterification of teichoic acids